MSADPVNSKTYVEELESIESQMKQIQERINNVQNFNKGISFSFVKILHSFHCISVILLSQICHPNLFILQRLSLLGPWWVAVDIRGYQFAFHLGSLIYLLQSSSQMPLLQEQGLCENIVKTSCVAPTCVSPSVMLSHDVPTSCSTVCSSGAFPNWCLPNTLSPHDVDASEHQKLEQYQSLLVNQLAGIQSLISNVHLNQHLTNPPQMTFLSTAPSNPQSSSLVRGFKASFHNQ